MLIRLLVVVLALVGAIPVRICTCGAAHHSPPAPAPRDADGEPASDSGSGIKSNSIPADHHDPDCHAVKPRPIMSLGLTCDTAQAPAGDTLAVAFADLCTFEPTSSPVVRDLDPPPDRPLFLTLLVLRI